MYCDDSSVKPVDSKQVVVRDITFHPLYFSQCKKTRAKRLTFCSTKEFDLRLPISYSIFCPQFYFLDPLLVVAIICILIPALSSFGIP